jgi:hypothetical protein
MLAGYKTVAVYDRELHGGNVTTTRRSWKYN